MQVLISFPKRATNLEYYYIIRMFLSLDQRAYIIQEQVEDFQVRNFEFFREIDMVCSQIFIIFV